MWEDEALRFHKLGYAEETFASVRVVSCVRDTHARGRPLTSHLSGFCEFDVKTVAGQLVFTPRQKSTVLLLRYEERAPLSLDWTVDMDRWTHNRRKLISPGNPTSRSSARHQATFMISTTSRWMWADGVCMDQGPLESEHFFWTPSRLLKSDMIRPAMCGY